GGTSWSCTASARTARAGSRTPSPGRRVEMGTRHGLQLRMRITIGITAALLAGAAEEARADRRTMIRAYEYQTQPKDNLEFELWNTVEVPRSAFADSVLVQRAELEYGITDHSDLPLYTVFGAGGTA